MGKLDFLKRLKTLVGKIFDMMSDELTDPFDGRFKVGAWIDADGNITAVEEENRSENIMPLDSLSDVVDIAEDLASYYYLLKRLRKVSKTDIKAQIETELAALLEEVWITYGLDEEGITDAREYISEYMQYADTIENWLEALF